MRKLLNLIVLLAVTGGALYFTVEQLKRDEQAANVLPEAGKTLLPGLIDRVNDVAAVEALSGGESYRLVSDAGRWTMPSKFGYPADGAKVRQLLIGLAGLVTVEPKTSNPALYERIGLADPASEDSEAVRFTGKDANDAVVFDVVLGERKFAPGDSTRSDIYVRVGDAPQSWLVTGKLPDETGADEWIDKRLAEIDRGRVASFAVTHADGEVVTALRDSADAVDFSYVELPAGAELDQQWRIDDIGRSLDGLDFDDVQPAAQALDGAQPAFSAVVQTFDGLQVDMDAQSVGEDIYVTLAASVREPPAAGEDMDSAEPDRAAAEDAADGSDADGADAAAEAETLNARWDGWRYKLPGYKAGHLGNRAQDLVKAPESNEASESRSAEDLGLPPVFDLQNPAGADSN